MFSAPDRNTSEEERFEDDYYSYFEQPENANRYKPAAYFLDSAFQQRSFSILDLGCGNGALSKYLPERCDYLGVDHSQLAIDRCLKLYPNRKFICQDLSVFLPQLVAENKKFDAVVLCGLLFHTVDKESLEKKSERELIHFCLQNIISNNGYLVIIIPFAYGDHPNHTLFVRAELLLNLVEEILSSANAKIVHENMCLLLGLSEKIRQQKMIPDWFIPDSSADYPNIYAGTYMASWTIISSPRR